MGVVRKGEYLERAVVIPGDARPLEGLFHRGARKPPLLIAPPHPSAGSMESPIVAELAWAVTRAGHPTLRFNYHGVGASGGSFEESAAIRAAWLAADHLRRCVARPHAMGVGEEGDGDATEDAARDLPVALLGIGFGAEVMCKLALDAKREARVMTPLLVLVAPDGDQLPPELDALETEVVLICAEKEGPSRREALERVAAGLRRSQGRLVVIPRADRAFVRGLVELGRVVAESIAPPGMIDLE